VVEGGGRGTGPKKTTKRQDMEIKKTILYWHQLSNGGAKKKKNQSPSVGARKEGFAKSQ